MAAAEDVNVLASSPLTLPCGLVLPNRLVKSALEEMMSCLGGGDPSLMHQRLHEAWAEGGWGLIISGNVQVSPSHVGLPFDVVFPSRSSGSYAASHARFRRWAQSSHSINTSAPTDTRPRTPSILQICHTGRQSMRGSGRPPWRAPLCPSATALVPGGEGLLNKVVFGTPRAMDHRDLDRVVDQFRHGARVARECGWDGVQLHAAHGYLLAQFLSPNINKRTDDYGGSLRARCKFLVRVIDAVRLECSQSSGFCLGIKLNSSDYVKGGLTEDDALETVKILVEHGGVDFIEISGGTYENVAFMQQSQSSAREGFFQSFAQRAQALVASLDRATLPSAPPAILITGGLRSRAGVNAALSTSCDLVGMGRPAAVDPSLPLKLLDPSLPDDDARAPTYSVSGGQVLRRLPGSELWMPGVVTLWHTMAMWEVARGQTVRLDERTEWKVIRVWLVAGLVEWWGRWGVYAAAVLVLLLALCRL